MTVSLQLARYLRIITAILRRTKCSILPSNLTSTLNSDTGIQIQRCIKTYQTIYNIQIMEKRMLQRRPQLQQKNQNRKLQKQKRKMKKLNLQKRNLNKLKPSQRLFQKLSKRKQRKWKLSQRLFQRLSHRRLRKWMTNQNLLKQRLRYRHLLRKSQRGNRLLSIFSQQSYKTLKACLTAWLKSYSKVELLEQSRQRLSQRLFLLLSRPCSGREKAIHQRQASPRPFQN